MRGNGHGGRQEGKGETNLHAEIGVRHSAVNSQFSKWSSTVFGHRVKDCFGLEAGCFKRGARNVAFLRIGCDANFIWSIWNPELNGRRLTDCPASIIIPVRGKKATERSNEGDAAVILDSLGKDTDLAGGTDEAEVVLEELD